MKSCTLLLYFSLYCTSATLTDVTDEPTNPSLGVTSFIVTSPSGNPAPGNPPRVSPNTQIQSDAVQTTCGAVIVRNYDTGMNIDVKIGTYDLAKNLPSGYLSTMICTNSPGFPPLPAEVTIMKTGSTKALLTKQVTAAELPDQHSTELKFTSSQPYNPGGNAPAAPTSEVTAAAPATPAAAISMTMMDFNFILTNTTLQSVGKLGSSPLSLSCGPFTIGQTISCSVIDYQQVYPQTGTSLKWAAGWTLFGLGGTEIRGYPQLTIKIPLHVGDFMYDGFVKEVPDSVGNTQLVALYGDFDINLPASSYSCIFGCPTNHGVITWGQPADKLEKEMLQCTTPDFTSKAGTPTGIQTGTMCTLKVNMDSKPLPIATGDESCQYNEAASAYPLLFDMQTSDFTIRPGSTIHVKVGTSCGGLMFVNDYAAGSQFTVTFNNTLWVDGLGFQEGSQLRCLEAQPTGTTNPVHLTVVDKAATPPVTIWDEPVPASVWQHSIDSSHVGNWNVVKISKFSGNAALAGSEYPIQDIRCSMIVQKNIPGWNLDCPTTDSTIGDDIPCTVPDVLAHSPNYPILTSPLGYQVMHLHCSMSWPSSALTPFPTPKDSVATIAMKPPNNDLFYIGFINTPGKQESLVSEKDWTAYGIFDYKLTNFNYFCHYTFNSKTLTVQAKSATDDVLTCATPDNTWYEGNFPALVDITVSQKQVATAVDRAVPATAPIKVEFVEEAGGGDGGKVAGIVIGVILGIVVIAGAAGAYVYFVRTKKHQGFVAIQ